MVGFEHEKTGRLQKVVFAYLGKKEMENVWVGQTFECRQIRTH